MRLIPVLLFASSALLAQGVAAQARIFCCTDDKGTRVCGDFLPLACQGRAYEERDDKGFIAKQVEAPLTPEQQAQREAEKARKEEEAKKAAEERRRNQALLATYSSEKDILAARDRALAEVEKNQKQAQVRLDEANKKKKKIDQDREFYKGKILPEEVKAAIRENEKEIAAQSTAVAAKIKEAADVRARFEDERKRYLELTGKKPGQDAGMGGMGAAATKPATTPAPAPAAAAKPAEKK
ncbi:MAG: hypothetical protein HZB40_02340 [Rhodocyclales bacterium]|nr:hypothetical protein [Rhodocyclales bacterium]